MEKCFPHYGKPHDSPPNEVLFAIATAPLAPHNDRMKSGRSPLKRPPLHNPAESLLEQRDNLVFDKVLFPFFATLILAMVTAFAWLDHFGILELNPNALTVFTIIGLAATTIAILRALKQARLINSGIAAEKAVGQFLEQFRAQGYSVIHDITVKTKDKAFNIDHLLIGPKGIFTIETKSWRKPMKGQCIVAYDGQKVLINGHAPDRDPIVQALGQAAWVRDYLASCTALSAIPVTPIVVYPGWFSNYQQSVKAKVKVVNEYFISACIQDSPHTLAPHDAKLIESRLADYIQRQTA